MLDPVVEESILTLIEAARQFGDDREEYIENMLTDEEQTEARAKLEQLDFAIINVQQYVRSN